MVEVNQSLQEIGDKLANLERLLSTPKQSWLLGAGVSCESNLPLMNKLTELVHEQIQPGVIKEALEAIRRELPDTSHIEDVLSYLGDLIALQQRRLSDDLSIGDESYTKDQLEQLHRQITESISRIVRWGYHATADGSEESDLIGTSDSPCVKVDNHRQFVRALLRLRANLETKRQPINFFTTNYDTLIEDALAIEKVRYWDGFHGGAVAFKELRFGDSLPSSKFQANVIKLHGSIDWYEGSDGSILRVRDFDTYPTKTKRTLIYPQSTKYVATQRDPYAAQFQIFRNTLSESHSSNVLGICGYSFGDEHINLEIEIAMSAPGNKTTLLVFTDHLSEKLKTWQKEPWSNRLIIFNKDGIYEGARPPYAIPRDVEGSPHNWWTFTGLTEALQNGLKGVLK